MFKEIAIEKFFKRLKKSYLLLFNVYVTYEFACVYMNVRLHT